jgi:urease accessory protein
MGRTPHHGLGAPRLADGVSEGLTGRGIGAAAAADAGWRAHLALHYTRAGDRTIALDRHTGPLRVLQRLYPEGPGICHHVLLHPPGGIAGGDELVIEARLDSGAHALVTTPGATRFYRSEGPRAVQRVQLQIAAGARLEWLPLETLAYPGCHAESVLRAELAPEAEMMGWEVLALGLPAAGAAFDSGSFRQHLELTGVWLERGCIAAEDRALRHSPLGWAGHPVLATAWFACGTAIAAPRRAGLLDGARAAAAASPLAASAGATAPQPALVLLRVLAPGVEPAMRLLAEVRAAWRQQAWGLAAEPPRIWRT